MNLKNFYATSACIIDCLISHAVTGQSERSHTLKIKKRIEHVSAITNNRRKMSRNKCSYILKINHNHIPCKKPNNKRSSEKNQFEVSSIYHLNCLDFTKNQEKLKNKQCVIHTLFTRNSNDFKLCT